MIRQVSKKEAAAFLLQKSGLRGQTTPLQDALPLLNSLGMIQVDSIKVMGLRSHELALAARLETDPGYYSKVVYDEKVFVETHYPLHAIRRDWVPLFLNAFNDEAAKNLKRRKSLSEEMKMLLGYIEQNGPVTAGQFRSKRVPGGFFDMKSTTLALEFLMYDRNIMICGRTSGFHRIFDLTERVAPELKYWEPPSTETYEEFLVKSTLALLHLCSRDQMVSRMRIHHGIWRKGFHASIRKKIADSYVSSGQANCVQVMDLPGKPLYWYNSEDEKIWDELSECKDFHPVIIPPFDNILFCRTRFAELFDYNYLFEGYKPRSQRRFYYGMPILFDSSMVGILDAKLSKGSLNIINLSIRDSLPEEKLRAAIFRLSRLVGATQVKPGNTVESRWKRVLSGTHTAGSE